MRIHFASADAAHLLRERAVRGLYRHRSYASQSITSTTDTDENRWRSLPAARVFNRGDGIIIQQSTPLGSPREMLRKLTRSRSEEYLYARTNLTLI